MATDTNDRATAQDEWPSSSNEVVPPVGNGTVTTSRNARSVVVVVNPGGNGDGVDGDPIMVGKRPCWDGNGCACVSDVCNSTDVR